MQGSIIENANRSHVEDIVNIEEISYENPWTKIHFQNDIKHCSTILYRSSGSAVQAAMTGAYPIYIKKKNELSIDPLYEIDKMKLSAYNDLDFIKIISKLKNKNYYKNKTDFISKYCKKYFNKPIRYNIKNIIND